VCPERQLGHLRTARPDLFQSWQVFQTLQAHSRP
jgi:hypothetical protein